MTSGRRIKKTGQSRATEAASTPDLSVLLPTYNRPDVLRRALVALENQKITKGSFEIVVVDDGSPDDTVSLLEDFSGKTTSFFSFVALRENGGPARARNVGLTMCRAPLILIIGDDIEPALSLVEQHLRFHRENPGEKYALLGYVSFPAELHPNAFMRWLEKGGRKHFFNYADLKPKQQAGPLFFYTCNVSVKTSLLDKSGWFDESFPFASHEDLELGYRLAERGMRLVYDPSARGYHWHMLTVHGIARRVYLMGYSADIFWRKVGESGDGFRRPARNILKEICSLPPIIFLWNRLREKAYSETKSYPIQWKVLLLLGFFIGLSDSRNNREVRV